MQNATCYRSLDNLYTSPDDRFASSHSPCNHEGECEDETSDDRLVDRDRLVVPDDDDGELTDAPPTVLEDKTDQEVAHREMTTSALCAAFVCLGLMIAIVGPCLVDLRHNVQASFQHITFIFTVRSVGYLIGALIGGILYDKMNGKLIVGFGLIGLGVSGYFIPWARSLLSLLIQMFLSGLLLGGIDTGGNMICVRLWGRKSGPFLQLMYFTFAVGATVSPLVVSPFLASQITSDELNLTTNTAIVTAPPLVHMYSQPVVFNSVRIPKLVNSSDIIDDGVNTSDLSTYLVHEFEIQTRVTDEKHDQVTNKTTRSYSDDVKREGSHLWVPFFIISSVCLVTSLPFFILYLMTSDKGDGQLQAVDSAPTSHYSHLQKDVSDSTPLSVKVCLLSLLGLFLFLYVGHEVVFGGFIFTFAVSSHLNISPQTASYLNSAFWGFFAASRASCVYIAAKISPRTILSMYLFGCFVGGVLLVAFGSKYVTILWFSTVLMGIAMAPIFPASVSWIERQFTLTGKYTSSFMVAASGSEILLPWLLGILFEKFSISIMFYVVLFLTVSAILVFTVLLFVARKCRQRERFLRKDVVDDI
ncbi:sodium-dependent glucose transporter 1A-like [Ptychodera flava]|uniref:sodium-dependent glucose transporter 1A-like n=1 Tax=Ptychodera flava TaxID=63121 RepID=UPI00396A3F8E